MFTKFDKCGELIIRENTVTRISHLVPLRAEPNTLGDCFSSECNRLNLVGHGSGTAIARVKEANCSALVRPAYRPVHMMLFVLYDFV